MLQLKMPKNNQCKWYKQIKQVVHLISRFSGVLKSPFKLLENCQKIPPKSIQKQINYKQTNFHQTIIQIPNTLSPENSNTEPIPQMMQQPQSKKQIDELELALANKIKSQNGLQEVIAGLQTKNMPAQGQQRQADERDVLATATFLNNFLFNRFRLIKERLLGNILFKILSNRQIEYKYKLIFQRSIIKIIKHSPNIRFGLQKMIQFFCHNNYVPEASILINCFTDQNLTFRSISNNQTSTNVPVQHLEAFVKKHMFSSLKSLNPEDLLTKQPTPKINNYTLKIYTQIFHSWCSVWSSLTSLLKSTKKSLSTLPSPYSPLLSMQQSLLSLCQCPFAQIFNLFLSLLSPQNLLITIDPQYQQMNGLKNAVLKLYKKMLVFLLNSEYYQGIVQMGVEIYKGGQGIFQRIISSLGVIAGRVSERGKGKGKRLEIKDIDGFVLEMIKIVRIYIGIKPDIIENDWKKLLSNIVFTFMGTSDDQLAAFQDDPQQFRSYYEDCVQRQLSGKAKGQACRLLSKLSNLQGYISTNESINEFLILFLVDSLKYYYSPAQPNLYSIQYPTLDITLLSLSILSPSLQQSPNLAPLRTLLPLLLAQAHPLQRAHIYLSLSFIFSQIYPSDNVHQSIPTIRQAIKEQEHPTSIHCALDFLANVVGDLGKIGEEIGTEVLERIGRNGQYLEDLTEKEQKGEGKGKATKKASQNMAQEEIWDGLWNVIVKIIEYNTSILSQKFILHMLKKLQLNLSYTLSCQQPSSPRINILTNLIIILCQALSHPSYLLHPHSLSLSPQSALFSQLWSLIPLFISATKFSQIEQQLLQILNFLIKNQPQLNAKSKEILYIVMGEWAKGEWKGIDIIGSYVEKIGSQEAEDEAQGKAMVNEEEKKIVGEIYQCVASGILYHLFDFGLQSKWNKIKSLSQLLLLMQNIVILHYPKLSELQLLQLTQMVEKFIPNSSSSSPSPSLSPPRPLIGRILNTILLCHVPRLRDKSIGTINHVWHDVQQFVEKGCFYGYDLVVLCYCLETALKSHGRNIGKGQRGIQDEKDEIRIRARLVRIWAIAINKWRTVQKNQNRARQSKDKQLLIRLTKFHKYKPFQQSLSTFWTPFSTPYPVSLQSFSTSQPAPCPYQEFICNLEKSLSQTLESLVETYPSFTKLIPQYEQQIICKLCRYQGQIMRKRVIYGIIGMKTGRVGEQTVTQENEQQRQQLQESKQENQRSNWREKQIGNAQKDILDDMEEFTNQILERQYSSEQDSDEQKNNDYLDRIKRKKRISNHQPKMIQNNYKDVGRQGTKRKSAK